MERAAEESIAVIPGQQNLLPMNISCLIIEGFLDRIDYPQSSVKIRSFQEKEEKRFPRPEKVLESREVASYRGKIGTFLVHVKYRQNATWQGEICWVEKGRNSSFRSELELLKRMDHALEAQ